jgi:hypothetical protein
VTGDADSGQGLVRAGAFLSPDAAAILWALACGALSQQRRLRPSALP